MYRFMSFNRFNQNHTFSILNILYDSLSQIVFCFVFSIRFHCHLLSLFDANCFFFLFILNLDFAQEALYHHINIMYILLMTTHHNTPFQIKHTASTDKNKTMCNCHAGTSFSAHSERSSDTSLVSTVNDNCIAKYTEFYLFIVFKSGFYFNKTHLLKLFFV